MRLLGRAVSGLACVALLVACAATIEHPEPGGPAFESDDIRFVAPSGWQIQPTTAASQSDTGHVLLYIANQPLRADCLSELDCRSPLADGLSRGGMLVTWFAHTCVARSCELPPATLISIGNREGVQVPLTNGCDETGFTERSAYYVTVTPQRIDVLFICARDPSGATRSAFLGFLDAIQWRIP
jgi:hypothetical protein